MGKSIRSKIKKRLRTVKRQRVDAMIVRPQTQEHYDSLMKVVNGTSVRLNSPKNAFRYPDAEGAVFAQHQIYKPIDFRASHLPMAGMVYRGNRKMRKYEGEQKEYIDKMKTENHPKEQVIAGGGVILAKTGKVVSKTEAAIIATAAERPEVAAIAIAGVASASSAVAAAVEADAEDEPASESGDDEAAHPGRADSDHLRPPIKKDTTKAARNRPRSNTVKKKTKPEIKVAAKAAGSPKKQKGAAKMQTD